MAGNQLGKTWAGAAELAMHLTGIYPDWFEGRRFDKAIKAIAGSESTELTRKGVQTLLIGPPETEAEWGTGMIPKDNLVNWNRRLGTPNALDSVGVKHVNGGVSTLFFQAYEQGRAKWQATTVEVVWFDEEPPEDIYSEGLTRTNATDGMVFMTFTPLKGMSNVVRRFLTEQSPDRNVTRMTIYDAEHYTPERIAQIVAGYPEHERDARASGIPILGSGRIFPLADADILVDPFEIPVFWPRICALDFGWDHPTAAVELVWNRDADAVYVVREHRLKQNTPAQHAAVLRTWGDVPWAWPHDGLQHDKGSGEQLAKQYRKEGLRLLGERATFSDGTFGVEAGLFQMLDRMRSGRWKVFRGMCPLWMEEFRLYHRDDGKVVKEHDDLISASRYAMMMLRHARVRSSMRANQRPEVRVAEGVGEVIW